MDKIVLKGKPREKLGSAEARRIRRSGWVPAIIYGHGKGTAHFQLEADAVSRIVHEGHHMVTIDVDGTVGEGLLKDIQFDAFGDQIVHVDFARISMDEVVETLVAIHPFGTAKGVSSGGILDMVHPEIGLRGKARDLPDHVEVDVTEMELADAIRIRDITLPEGVEAVLGPDDPVIILHPPRGLDVDEAADEDAPTEPEVIDDKKKDEESEE